MATIIRRGGLPADNYTIISNAWARDARLSFKARGLLLYLCSHMAGWSTSVQKLQDHTTDRKAAINTAIDELEEAGYLIRTQIRDARGRLGDQLYEIVDPFDGRAQPVHDAQDEAVHTDDDFQQPAVHDAPMTGNPTQAVHSPETLDLPLVSVADAQVHTVHSAPLTDYPSTVEDVHGAAPLTDYPSTDFPSTDNQPLKKNNLQEDQREEDKDFRARQRAQSPALFAVVSAEDQFDQLWALWPNKKNRARAHARWVRLSPRQRAEVLPRALEHAAAFAAHTEKQFIPMLATWIHDERWDDPLAEPEHRRASHRETPDERTRRILHDTPMAPRGPKPPEPRALGS